MIKQQKIKAIATKQHKNRGNISTCTEKNQNYNSNIGNINSKQKNNLYLISSYN